MITVEQLQHAITERISNYNQDDSPLSKRATQTFELLESKNHILAQDIISPFSVPRNDLSAMDGYATAKGSNLSKDNTIEIVGESQAGSPFTGDLQSGQGIRIFTGAVVPNDCDTVIMQENTDFDAIKNHLDKSQPYAITLTQAAKIDNNIRKQGEEIESGEVVLKTGKRLNPADISLLANLGIDKVEVFKPITVGVLATGDELVALGDTLDNSAQIYNSNTPTLKSLLADLPVTIHDYGIIPDHLDKTANAVTAAMQECDVLISTAGVSVGDYDFLTTVIEQLGQINHYKVAMKPGKPFVFGELNKDLLKPVLYFGLPGNPLSTIVGTLQFVIPALWQLSGVRADDLPLTLSMPATLENEVKKSAGRTDFQRGVLSQDNNGKLQVKSFAKQQSHRIKQFSQANCLMVLAKDEGNLSAGEQVQVQPFPWS
ncbi:molybdopterin molybdotransferase MoeA [Psychrobacter jeotgali]|uniref:molybdopterin molybdotransferase MoeA n=1 Tax=Psychrobacter jeotgali TaxID=179010 RepID=UPI00191AAF0A|nr:gephyrin-like molybdotransferase Glp [Psychrobacter jeotgali]